MSGKKFKFPIAGGMVKLSGGDQVPSTSTLIRGLPRPRRRRRNSSRRIRRLFFNPTSRLIVAWWWSQKWFLDVTKATSTSLDVMLEKISTIIGTLMEIETCQTRGHVLQGSRYSDEKTTGWIYLVREETDKKANDIQTRLSVARNWERHVRSVEAKRKAKVGNRKNWGFTMPENCVVFTSSIQQMKTSRTFWKNARRKLEVPMPAAMLCRTKQPWTNAREVGSACGSSYVLQGHESPVQGNLRRIRHSQQIKTCMHHGSSRVHEEAFGMNSAIRSRRSHCREGIQFIKTLQSCAQVHSCAPSNENTRCENSSGQGVGEAFKKTGMAADESQKQKGGDRWSKERKNSAACVSNGHPSSQECGVVTPISEIHRLGRAPRWHCERRFRLSCSIHRAGFVVNTNGGRRRNGCPCKATRMCRTSSRRSISLYPSQSGGRTKIIETSKVSMPRGLDTSSTTHNGPNRGQTSKIQWFLLKEICMVTHLPDYCGKFEEGLVGTRMGEGTELRMPLRASKARSILIWDTCMTFKWLEESRSWVLCGRNWWNWLTLENRHHFLTTCTWDAFNVSANRTKLSLLKTKKCSNHESVLERLRNYLAGKKSHAQTVARSYDMEGHAKKCVER